MQKRNGFLLDLAEAGEGADIAKIARENGIRNPDKVLENFTGYVGANRMKSPQTYPNEVLGALNAGVPDNSDQLNPQDIEDLGWVIDRYAPRLIQKFGGMVQQPQYQQPPQYQQYQQQYYQQQQYQQPPQQQQYYGRSPTPPAPQGGIVLPAGTYQGWAMDKNSCRCHQSELIEDAHGQSDRYTMAFLNNR